MKIFGKEKEDISLTPLDFYSFGHLIFGHMAFIIIYLMGFYNLIHIIGISMMDRALAMATAVGIFWELLENNLFVKTHLKKRKDSLNNSVCDILCVFIGAAIICIFVYFYGFTSMMFLTINTVILLIYFMCFYMLEVHTIREC